MVEECKLSFLHLRFVLFSMEKKCFTNPFHAVTISQTRTVKNLFISR